MLTGRRKIQNFWSDRSSTAAIEFAFVLTPMVFILAGIYDLSEAVILRAEIYNAAQTMSASATAEAVQSDGSTALTYDQIQQVESTIWALVPSLRSGLHNGTPMSVTITSLEFYPNPFNPCSYKAACTYYAETVWSEAYTGGDSGQTFQPNINSGNPGCSEYVLPNTNTNQVGSTATISGTYAGEPANVSQFRTAGITNITTSLADGNAETEAGISPVLVVSIQYTYKPLFTKYLTGPITFWVDGYWPVRSVASSLTSLPPQEDFNGTGTFTVQALTRAYTTINNASLSGSDVNSNYVCTGQVSNPGPTS